MKRRNFLVASVTVGAGFAIGYKLLDHTDRGWESLGFGEDQVVLGPYIVIDDRGITLLTPRAEMGQGIHTTLAALVAEELDVELSAVSVEHGPASELYRNTKIFPEPPGAPANYLQEFANAFLTGKTDLPTTLTGAQASIQDGFVKMREAGAAARFVLVKAAAQRLGVSPAELRTGNGEVHDANGARIPYEELAEAAAAIPLPEEPALKARTEWKLLGHSQPRVDMEPKCTGRATYGMDVRLPGMLFASVRRNPSVGAPMKGFDASRAMEMPGIRKVVPLKDGIVVIATNTWHAIQAADAVDIRWGAAAYPDSIDEHFRLVEEALEDESRSRLFRDDGDVDAALTNGQVIAGEYRAPYLAHATMEPMNAVAWFRDGQLDIWAGNQYPTKAVAIGAEICGISRNAIEVHTTYMGCGFGRRLEMDFIEVAVRAAQALEGTPVLVSWTREEDMTHDAYRPLSAARFRAGVANGLPRALEIKASSPSLGDSLRLREGQPLVGTADKFVVTGLKGQPYAIANYRVIGYPAPVERLLPVGWWRSVGESQNSFFHESILDELAHVEGVDPLAMRLDLLDHAPSREVLAAVAEMSGWGSELPEGHARGVAFVLSSGAPTAQVAEVRWMDGSIEIVKICVAVDVGIALDPDNIEAQIHSSVIFGLSSAMTGEISVTNGRVDQRNLDTYKIMRMHEVPEIETRIIQSGKQIFGVGESATPAAAPALGNAIFAATGQRIRELPFDKFVRFN